MTTDAEMGIDYSQVLMQLRHDLAKIDGRRQALMASIAALSRLVDDDEAGQTSLPLTADNGRGAESQLPVIPPGFFKDKSPTEAYRTLLTHWPGSYSPPQIADMFMQGGISATSRTGLIQAIHSVLKRERQRLERERIERDVLAHANGSAGR